MEPLLVLPFSNVFEAAVAAFPEVTLTGAFRWDSAEPAADFDVLLVDLFLRTFDAAVAARLLVTSLFFTIAVHLKLFNQLLANFNRRCSVEYEIGHQDEKTCEHNSACQASYKVYAGGLNRSMQRIR